MLEKDKQTADTAAKKLQSMLMNISETLNLLNKYEVFIITKEELLKIAEADCDTEEKAEIIYQLKKEIQKLIEEYSLDIVRKRDLLRQYQTQKVSLENEVKNLKNRKFTYPDNTTRLKTAIEKEFFSQGIKSEVRIFSDLLEITDTRWQNAVEGYLNSQRFYIIVESQYYKVASEVYNRIKKEVHTVGLANTGKLDVNAVADINSLAYVIKSDNRYAKAYAVYLLNRVIRCDDVQSLKEHKVAITADYMLYQNYALRKIDEKVYNTPFIGAFALEIQLKNKQAELINLNEDIKTFNERLNISRQLLDKLNSCKIDVLKKT
jgi:hypothetical protein